MYIALPVALLKTSIIMKKVGKILKDSQDSIPSPSKNIRKQNTLMNNYSAKMSLVPDD